MSDPIVALSMLCLFLIFIFLGFPIAFTLMAVGIFFGFYAYFDPIQSFFENKIFYLFVQNTYSVMSNDVLISVPLFLFMGYMVERANILDRLFLSLQVGLRGLPGSMALAALITCALFATATGIVGAVVTLMGLLALPAMLKAGYDQRLSAGVITAGGTLGILIPPSIMLIVMGPVLEVSTLDLFRGAFIPGALLASLYLFYTLGRCWLSPELGPILPEADQPKTSDFYGAEVALISIGVLTICRVFGLGLGGTFGGVVPFGGLLVLLATILLAYRAYRNINALKIVLPLAIIFHGYLLYVNWIAGSGTISFILLAFMLFLAALAAPIYRSDANERFQFSDIWDEFFAGLMPPTILISFALGSILLGFATPAEAAAMGAFGAILLSLAYRKFTIPGFFDNMIKSLEITVLIMFLVAASNFFGAEFSSLGTPKMMTEMLLGMDMSPYLILILIMALIFLLGWPLEWVPIVLIVVPILLPTVLSLDVHGLSQYDLMVWFGILVAVNLQTAWLSPPVALSAYFLKGVVPNWDLKDIYLGMMQFMVIQLIGLILIFIFPQIVLWLPNQVFGS